MKTIIMNESVIENAINATMSLKGILLDRDFNKLVKSLETIRNNYIDDADVEETVCDYSSAIESYVYGSISKVGLADRDAIYAYLNVAGYTEMSAIGEGDDATKCAKYFEALIPTTAKDTDERITGKPFEIKRIQRTPYVAKFIEEGCTEVFTSVMKGMCTYYK